MIDSKNNRKICKKLGVIDPYSKSFLLRTFENFETEKQHVSLPDSNELELIVKFRSR